MFLVDGGKFIKETKESREIFAVVVGGGIGAEPPNIPRCCNPY